MKKLILIAGIALLSLSAKAQKLEKPRIDKFKGDTTLITSQERLDVELLNSRSLQCYAMKYKGDYSLIFEMVEGVDINFTISPENSCLLKLKGGSIITLKTLTTANSELKFADSKSYVIAHPLFDLNYNDIIALKKSPITDIRIETSHAPLDYEIKQSKGDVINKCIQLLVAK